MQECRRQSAGIKLKLRQDISGLQGVFQIRVSGETLLTLVLLGVPCN